MGCQFEIVREELKPAVVLIVEPLHQTVGEGGIAFFSDVLLELNLVVAPRSPLPLVFFAGSVVLAVSLRRVTKWVPRRVIHSKRP